MTETIVKNGQTISLKIKRLGINGEGIGYFKRLTIFVPYALPKEEVLVKITKTTSRYAQGQLIKIKKTSNNRVVAPCPVYYECGGCQLQHLAYQAQLDFKKDLLMQALEKFKPVGFRSYQLRPTIGMANPWHYRNKAQFQLRKNRQKQKIEAGLYQANSHQLVPLTDCLVQEPQTQKVMNTVVKLLNTYDLPIYDEQKNSGIFRTIMVRVGIKTGELQVVFITRSQKFPQKNAIIREINQKLPEVVSIMQNVQPNKTPLVMGDETFHLWGKEAIEERLNEVTFDLSPRAFFQLNPRQTVILYNEGIKALAVQPNETIVDAYCGVGTIGLSVAKQAKEIRGMDIIPQAIEDAKKNARRLGYTNSHYEVGTAEELLPRWLRKGFKPDGIIVDPPRTGLDSQLIQTLLNNPPTKLVYISCNVSTLARDLVQLSKKFKVDYLQSVDMFPQTARCEVVAKLTKK
ncbi:23S rRNA (uracil(1939)-C(5))-methyltransferase RlmD [Enterococcus ratti]|uniref:23S rRNA (uracil(1939)-C(5))-methyltransferase RlmD n=1 Tax=Enterococcus ratti TaxID=150033 RepID=UPI003516E8E9